MVVGEASRLHPYCAKPPGAAGTRLNYSLTETAVNIDVLEKVRNAKAEVLDKYSPDILGVKPPAWKSAVCEHSSKHSCDASDLKLCNSLRPELLNKTDLRTYLGTTTVSDSHRYHAFDRGVVTTGWNFSTVAGTKQEQHSTSTSEQPDLTGKSAAWTRKEPVHYVSLYDRERAFIAAQRRRKTDSLEGRSHVAAAYAIQHTKPRIKATKADLQAVLNLPADVTSKVPEDEQPKEVMVPRETQEDELFEDDETRPATPGSGSHETPRQQ